MGFINKSFYLPKPIPSFLFLMQEFGISQKESQKWLDCGRVKQNNRICHKSEKLQGTIEVTFLQKIPNPIEPIFDSPYFSIFDKPANLLSHPKGLFDSLSLYDSVQTLFGTNAKLTHRLDKETSGLVLVAKNTKIASQIGQLFMQKAIEKNYLAYVEGKITESRQINLPLLQLPKGGDLCVRMQIDSKGKEAQTLIEPLHFDSKRNATLLLVQPKTGRTHQIRTHLFAIGHRILGDPLYGTNDSNSRDYLEGAFDDLNSNQATQERYLSCFGAKRLMLHAFALRFGFAGCQFAFTSKMDFKL